ncbi:lipopolysaccharide biosynthesis protein [candidate division KSB1 bacterium]|nr:lipopolysaccharide biosynthesis protein [candidate division KSB1 bacterium]
MADKNILNESCSNSAIQGIRWNALGEYSTQGVTFVIYIVLARLLEPHDFGLLAMAMIFIGITDLLSRLGTNTVVIQQKSLSQELLSSLFFLNLGMGLVVGVLLIGLSPFLGWLIKNPAVTPILQILSVTFVIQAIGSVHNGLLRRKLLFNRIAILNFSVAIIKGAVAICLALLGYRVWALVIAVIVASMLRTLFLFIATGWSPSFCLDWAEIRRVRSFIYNITGFGLFNSFASRAGNFLIGRFLGAASLGIYSIAFKLFTLPNQYVSHVVGNVLLSALSAVQENNSLLQKKYLRASAGIALITFPLSIGLALVAKPFVLTLYGDKWSAAAPIITILSLVGSIHSIAVISGNIFIAKGRTRLWLGWGVFSGTVSSLSVLCGLPWGLMGVTVAYAFSSIILVYVSFIISCRLIDLRMADFISVLMPYLRATLIMAAVVILLRVLFEHFFFPPVIVLAGCICGGLLAYSFIMLMTRPPAFVDLAAILTAKCPAFVRVRSMSR